MFKKKGLRYFVNPRGIIFIGFIIVITVYIYKYLIQLQCFAGTYCQVTEKKLLDKVNKDRLANKGSTSNVSNMTKVYVNVNYKEKFTGLKINNELYVPFKFLKSYYEIYGEFVTDKSVVNLQSSARGEDEDYVDSFLWLHTMRNDLDVRNLRQDSYSPYGMYLNFKESDVAHRARVKCICGKYEVPITTQWDANGYYYPTQIAQYGLSHLSKYFGGDNRPKEYNVKLKPGISGKFSARLNIDLRILKVKVAYKMTPFSIKVIASDQNKYILSYTTDNSMITRMGKTITHGLGDHIIKDEIVRDLNVDIVKGLSYREGKRQGNTVNISIRKIYEIMFQNIRYVTSVQFTNVDHVSMFLAAANWFVHFQDGAGGWKTNVSRVVFKGMRRDAGWYSSMGQGQALSLLSRVYKYTGNTKYLRTALKATQVFNVPSHQEGVLAMLFGKYPWYEEYPTTPSLYVLNGFIYSLFGLYDLSKAASERDSVEAIHLFKQGLSSLETLLPLFDSGHGSFYDLRHISVPGHPPNRARWQYHRVHLEQLFAIVDITKSSMINKTLHRWIQYAVGVPARHN